MIFNRWMKIAGLIFQADHNLRTSDIASNKKMQGKLKKLEIKENFEFSRQVCFEAFAYTFWPGSLKYKQAKPKNLKQLQFSSCYSKFYCFDGF